MAPHVSQKKGSAVRLCTYFGNVTPLHCWVVAYYGQRPQSQATD